MWKRRAGEVVAFEVAGFVDRFKQRTQDGLLVFGIAVGEHAQDFSGDLEDGHVVDVGADLLPSRLQGFGALGGDFLDGGDVVAHEREPAVERKRVEQHQAADSLARFAFLFVGRFGDDFGDESGDAGVGVEAADGLGERVADFERGGVDAVGTLDLEREQAQLGGQRLHLAFAQDRIVVDLGAGAVQVPLEIAEPAEHVADVVFDFEVVGVEHAEASDGVGEVVHALGELAVQLGAAALPLALDQDQLAGGQLEAEVGCVAVAAALGAGGGCRAL